MRCNWPIFTRPCQCRKIAERDVAFTATPGHVAGFGALMGRIGRSHHSLFLIHLSLSCSFAHLLCGSPSQRHPQIHLLRSGVQRGGHLSLRGVSHHWLVIAEPNPFDPLPPFHHHPHTDRTCRWPRSSWRSPRYASRRPRSPGRSPTPTPAECAHPKKERRREASPMK